MLLLFCRCCFVVVVLSLLFYRCCFVVVVVAAVVDVLVLAVLALFLLFLPIQELSGKSHTSF